MKRLKILVCISCMIVFIFGVLYIKGKTNVFLEQAPSPSPELEKVLLTKGDVIKAGSYLTLDDVEFLYDGKFFLITNNREDSVTVQASVYGVKADGSVQFLGCPAFSGIDWKQYEIDKDINGWAWEQRTNHVEPGETLNAIMDCFLSEMDVDKDGYYDVSFQIHPQYNEDPFHSLLDDPESDIYKFPVQN